MMKKLIILDQIQQTRVNVLRRARKISAYFSIGGGNSTDDDELPKLAWTSDDQKQRSQDFKELAAKLAKKNRAA